MDPKGGSNPGLPSVHRDRMLSMLRGDTRTDVAFERIRRDKTEGGGDDMMTAFMLKPKILEIASAPTSGQLRSRVVEVGNDDDWLTNVWYTRITLLCMWFLVVDCPRVEGENGYPTKIWMKKFADKSDVVIEIFTDFLNPNKKFSYLPERAPFSLYLKRIVANNIADRYNRDKRALECLLVLSADTPQPPYTSRVERPDIDEIMHVIDRLASNLQEFALALYRLGSARAAAEELGVCRQTFMRHLRTEVKKFLAELGCFVEDENPQDKPGTDEGGEQPGGNPVPLPPKQPKGDSIIESKPGVTTPDSTLSPKPQNGELKPQVKPTGETTPSSERTEQ